jgi:hypothetical protein
MSRYTFASDAWLLEDVHGLDEKRIVESDQLPRHTFHLRLTRKLAELLVLVVQRYTQ